MSICYENNFPNRLKIYYDKIVLNLKLFLKKSNLRFELFKKKKFSRTA